MVQLFWGCFFDYVFEANFCPIHFLFTSYSFPIDSYSFLFISYSLPIHFLFMFIHFFSFSLHSYSLPIHVLFIFIHFFHFLWPEKFIKIQKKAWIFFLINLLFKNYWFQAPNQLGKGVPHKSPKKWLIKGVVNKVLDLDGLFISYSMLIHFLFKFYSCPIQLLLWSHSFLFILVAFISKGVQ